MKPNTFLKKMTSKQLENRLLIVVGVVMGLSMIEPLASAFLLVLLALTPLATGHGIALLFDFMDDSIEYEVQFSKKTHLLLALAVSIVIGAALSRLSSLMPLFPYHPVTNAFFLVIPPRTVFFVWGLIIAGVGYWRAWRLIPNKKQRA